MSYQHPPELLKELAIAQEQCLACYSIANMERLQSIMSKLAQLRQEYEKGISSQRIAENIQKQRVTETLNTTPLGRWVEVTGYGAFIFLHQGIQARPGELLPPVENLRVALPENVANLRMKYLISAQEAEMLTSAYPGHVTYCDIPRQC